MPRKNSVPKYCKHPNGQAYVCFEGRKEYLGKHGSDASLQRYEQFVARIRGGLSRLAMPANPVSRAPLVKAVVDAYLDFAEQHYERAGQPSKEFMAVRKAATLVVYFFGEDLAESFGPRSLKVLMRAMVDHGYTRSHVNHTKGRVIRIFKWAASEEIIDPVVYHRLLCVAALQRGQFGVREAEPVKPVTLEQFQATLPHLSPVVRDMARVQYLCGMRPAEVCIMRPCDIDRGGDVWLYRPQQHKNEWRGHDLVKAIPTAAQQILLSRMLRATDAYLFEPAEAIQWAIEQRRATSSRKTKRFPSEAKRVAKRSRRRHARPKRKYAGAHYTTDSYRRAIWTACDRAFPHPALEDIPLVDLTADQAAELAQWRKAHRWSPNQLRHAVVTLISTKLGQQKAQRFAGHENLETTAIYDEKQVAEIVDVARQLDQVPEFADWARAS